MKEDVFRTTFKLSVEEIKYNCSSRLNSYSKIMEEIKDIYDKEFEINILGKDKSINKKIKTRLIPSIIQDEKTKTIEITLEPLTIGSLRKMIAKKKKIDLPENKHTNLVVTPYLKLSYSEHRDITFYPAKVVYEIIRDYENIFIPEISIEDFKVITHTTDKYKTSYGSNVLKKIEIVLNEKFNINVKITPIKFGKCISKIKIESDLNKNMPRIVTFEEIKEEFFEYLKAGGLEPKANYPKTVLSGFLKSKNYIIK